MPEPHANDTSCVGAIYGDGLNSLSLRGIAFVRANMVARDE